MELRGFAGLVLALTLAPSPARAQTAAGEPHVLGSDVVRGQQPQAPAQVGIGARIGGGLAYADGVSDAWMARLDYEVFPFLTPRDRPGGLFGFLIGYDFWRGEPNNWGMSLPFAVVGGVRAFPVRALVGVGFDAFVLDQVRDDTGFGVWAPLALADVGLDMFGWTVMGDARVSRRWQFGADDHTQWMFSIMVGATLEPKYNRAFYDKKL